MWRSMTKPTILGTTSFWVKATITKYNLWSTDHANLKSLAPVGSEIWARMYLDRLYYNFTASIMKHCHCMFLNWFKTTKSYHRQLVWFISHTESQHNMVGFAMDGHIRRNYFLMSSLKWAQQVYNYTMDTPNIMVESTDWSIQRHWALFEIVNLTTVQNSFSVIKFSIGNLLHSQLARSWYTNLGQYYSISLLNNNVPDWCIIILLATKRKIQLWATNE